MYYIMVDCQVSAQHFETMLHLLKVKISLRQAAPSSCKTFLSHSVLFSLAEAAACTQSQ